MICLTLERRKFFLRVIAKRMLAHLITVSSTRKALQSRLNEVVTSVRTQTRIAVVRLIFSLKSEVSFLAIIRFEALKIDWTRASAKTEMPAA